MAGERKLKDEVVRTIFRDGVRRWEEECLMDILRKESVHDKGRLRWIEGDEGRRGAFGKWGWRVVLLGFRIFKIGLDLGLNDRFYCGIKCENGIILWNFWGKF